MQEYAILAVAMDVAVIACATIALTATTLI